MVKKLVTPVIKITPEIKARLEGTIEETIGIRKAIASLKELGLDTAAIEEKLEWAEKARDILLRDFT